MTGYIKRFYAKHIKNYAIRNREHDTIRNGQNIKNETASNSKNEAKRKNENGATRKRENHLQQNGMLSLYLSRRFRGRKKGRNCDKERVRCMEKETVVKSGVQKGNVSKKTDRNMSEGGKAQ